MKNILSVLLVVAALALSTPVFALVGQGKAIFEEKCTACHTISEGVLVGPELAGVTKRREAEWLRRFIQVPSELFEEEDPIAMELLEEYMVPMADLGITDEETDAIIAYLETT